MFNSIFDSFATEYAALIALIAAILLGVVIAVLYMFVKRKSGYLSDFPITLVLLVPVASIVIFLISDNLAAGITVGGLFALTRFRSVQKSTEDITYLFLAVAIGVAVGLGYVAYAAIFTLIISLVVLILFMTKFGQPDGRSLSVRIVIPEQINYENLFDEVMERYCASWSLTRVRTADFGTMLEVSFFVVMRQDADQKKFLDELRVRNGNLTITMTVQRFNSVDR
jgi:hypothetical protein